MLEPKIIYNPVKGKTFSLFGKSADTEEYFEIISRISDRFLLDGYEMNDLIYLIRDCSKNKRKLKKLSKNKTSDHPVSRFLHTLNYYLSDYTSETEKHLKEISFSDRLWDKRLGTSREQYHIYMLEIELVNRLNKEKFKACDYAIALLPHCVRDLEKNCKAENDGFDMVCKNCSENCYINHISEILKQNKISPYIWMDSDFKQLSRKLKNENRKSGVLGIACIPELIWGMRKCTTLKIPVVGIPLNANRCARWMDKFYPNSIDLRQLEKLLN